MSSGHPCLPLRQRLQLYNEVLQLRRQGLSYAQVMEKIHGLHGISLHKRQIQYWVHGVHTPLGNVHRFEAKPSATLAYVIGVKNGDGWTYHNKKYHARLVGLQVTDYDFAQVTGQKLANLVRRKKSYEPIWNKDYRQWRILCCSTLLYEFLQQPLENLRHFIEHCRSCVAAFLRAVFDSEACISGRKFRNLRVNNTDKGMLIYVQRLLRQYFRIKATGPHKGREKGYHFRSKKSKASRANRAMYYLHIRADSLPRFFRYVGFTIGRKQQRLVEASRR